MSDSLNQSLSAMLDNEADELELRRVLKACAQDPELLQRWQRYSSVQAALHDSAIKLPADFAARISREIDGIPHGASPFATLSAWQQNLAKLAVAASVAAVFFLALQVGLGPTGSSPEMAVNESPAAAPVASSLVAEATNPAGTDQIAPMVKAWIDSIYLDVEEPVRTEHLQDSPLYRLVNELPDQ